MHAVAQRAFSDKHRVQVDVDDWKIKSIAVFR
jgi:hypothetical protein